MPKSCLGQRDKIRTVLMINFFTVPIFFYLCYLQGMLSLAILLLGPINFMQWIYQKSLGKIKWMLNPPRKEEEGSNDLSFSHQKIHSRIHLFYWYPSVLEYWNMEYHNNGINSITFCFAILYKLEV